MPGDPFRPVVPGEPFEPTADQWNRILAAARDSAQAQADAIGKRSVNVPLAPGCILAKASSDLAAFTAVSIGSPILAITSGDDVKLDLLKYRETIWNIGAFSVSNEGMFGLTQQPIKSGQIGIVRIKGLTPALITVASTSYIKYCRPQSSPATKMKSGSFGGSRILTIESGTGDKWGIIDLRSERYQRIAGDLAGSLTTGATQTFNVKVAATSTSETASIKDLDSLVTSTLTSGKRVYGWFDFDQQLAILDGWKC